MCDDGWGDEDCSMQTCVHNCSGNGTCDEQTHQCDCNSVMKEEAVFDGQMWTGMGCEERTCPSGCDVNGFCDKENGIWYILFILCRTTSLFFYRYFWYKLNLVFDFLN